MGTYMELHLGSIGPGHVCIAAVPGISLLPTIADVVGARRGGLPAPWRETIRRAVPPEAPDARTLLSLGATVVPDSLMPPLTCGVEGRLHSLLRVCGPT
jgi:hypothetical protein